MKKITFKISIFSFLFFFFSHIGYSQLANFSFTVTRTNETCTANGTLLFATSGTTAGSTMVYSIYLLPNTTSPIAVTANTTYTGLTAGVYSVVATQTLGSLTNSQQQNSTIQNLTVPLVFQLTGQIETCNNGSITVNVSQGNPVTYEILSGPIVVAPQSSNVFNNLQSGTYNIRVNDACGDGVVQTFTISQAQYITIGNFLKSCQLVNCNTITGNFIVNALQSYTISYPFTVVFTITPPGGGNPVVVNQTVNSGSPISQTVNINLPYYQGQNFYTIKVTDACGNEFLNSGNSYPVQFSLQLSQQLPSSCVKEINLSLCDFLPPYSVVFLNSPSGFNPNNFNTIHPGPFTSEYTTYSSTGSNSIPNGSYTVQVTDACARVIQNTFVVSDFIHQIVIDPFQSPCTQLTHVIDNLGGPDIANVSIISAPSGYGFPLPHDVSFNVNNGGFGMDLLPGTYTFLITDVCGLTFQSILTIPPRQSGVTALGGNTPGCSLTSGFINVSSSGGQLISIQIINAPAAYNQTLPYNASSSIVAPNNINAFIPFLAPGTYTLVINNSCGNPTTLNVVVPLLISQVNPIVDYRRGCLEGSSSLSMYSPNGALQSVVISAAPTTFNQSLPFNASSNIAFNGRFYLNNIPQGLYTFTTLDVCGVTKTFSLQIVGFSPTINNVTIQPNCGSFNLNLQYVSNATYSVEFWLQKFNAVTNSWQHPITGIAYPNGSIPNLSNSIYLLNSATQLNIASTGTFRVVKSYFSYTDGLTSLSNCIETIDTFQFTGELNIISAYAFPCSTGGTEVVINAEGIAPLNYQITLKDGLPFVVNNGTSNNFSGLLPGVYNFQVTDLCGNVVTSLIDISTLPEPVIASSNLCNGLVGELSVQSFAYLNYQWWKGTATTTILSTTNVLTFNPFSNATTPGTYYVRIYSLNATSCVDKILSFIIPAISLPNAGSDGVITLCGGTSSLNLNTILVGSYDLGGTWEEITSSGGTLTSNSWSPIGANFGTFTFKYRIDGLCSSFDESFVTVNYNEAPPIPIITADVAFCVGNTIELSVATITNASYEWLGPNNFSSTIQNPIIENSTELNSGIYTVKAKINSCESISSIDLLVNKNPSFTISDFCLANNYTVLVTPTNNSFDQTSVSYTWSGPDGYSNTDNPINLTGKPIGIYTVNVTNFEGCSLEQSITVENSLCTIPKGISPNGDGDNDEFDLSGFDVDNLKIFNRYGMVVYEKGNYEKEWVGQDYNGNLLPTATYYYLVRLESGEGKTGWVYVSRN